MFCYPYLYDSFLNNGFEVDVFYHSYNINERVIDLWKPKKVIRESEEEVYQKIISNITFPIDYSIGNQNPDRYYSTLMMFYGINKIINEAINYNNYDLIIRCRPDIFLYEKIDLGKIINHIKDVKYDLCIPNKQYNYSDNGYNDQLAFGNESNMKIYSEVYNHLNEYIPRLTKWYGEDLLALQLNKYNLKIEQPNINYQLIRDVNFFTNHKNIPPYKLY